ncbi:MAG: hypothetical protein AABY93_12415 [Bacteroidota bacterium]
MKAILVLILLSSTLALAQTAKRDSIWAPIKNFIGNWKGEGGGEPGIGKYERSYQFILNNNFIEIRNKSTYPPTDKNPKGEVHEDIGYIIYDKGRKTFLLRQLHVEGFANDYALESISADKKTLVFVTDAIVNIPKGWKGRETYRLLSATEIEETFELAPPDKEFSVYSKVKLVKQ